MIYLVIEMRTENEIEQMIEKLWDLEADAPNYLKENYKGAIEVLDWVLENMGEEDVISFGK